MFLYAHLGTTNYTRAPIRAVPINRRKCWEFLACLEGEIRADLPAAVHDESLRGRSLWVFPRLHAHGWLSDAPCERALFHFERVPHMLEQKVPARGYYRVTLTDTDCDRLRVMAETAITFNRQPDVSIQLLETALVAELSLLALRDVPREALSPDNHAVSKVAQAMNWYAEHMSTQPGLTEIAKAVYVSPSYLRQLFHRARNESPHNAFNRIRMERAKELLADANLTLDTIAEQVGLSSASALSRAIKHHYGMPPSQLEIVGKSGKPS